MRYAKVSFSGVTYTKTPIPGTTETPMVSVGESSSQALYLPYDTTLGYYVKDLVGSGLYTHSQFETIPKTFFSGYRAAFAIDDESGTLEFTLKLPIRLNTSEATPYDVQVYADLVFADFSSSSTPPYVATNNSDYGTGTALITLYDDDNYNYLDLAGRGLWYDPTAIWGWDGYLWRWISPTETTLHPSLLAAGGGRYHQSVIAVAHGTVYYGSLT